MEPSLLDYARFYGLTRNHLEPNPLQDVVVPNDFFTQLEDPPGAFQIDASQSNLPLETLSLDRDAAMLLTSIKQSSASKESFQFDEVEMPDPHRIRNMKLDLPLLHTDHELDVLHFRYRGMRDLAEEHLPLESVDEENDEGLSWPLRYLQLPGEFNRKSESEKLDMTKDTLLYLQRILQVHHDGGVRDRFEYDEKPYRRVRSRPYDLDGADRLLELRFRPSIATSTTSVTNAPAIYSIIRYWLHRPTFGTAKPYTSAD